MKYTFVVAFALALAGHADASSAPNKRQTTQEVNDFLASGKATNGMVTIPNLPREEKRQTTQEVNDFLASGKATNGMVMIPNLPREEKRQLADMTSEGWRQAVEMHEAAVGSPQNLPKGYTAQEKRQITAENLAQFEQNLATHNAGLTSPPVIPRQLGDMTPEEHKATIGKPVTHPAEITQEKRQDLSSPEMQEAIKVHAAYFGHPLSGSVIKEKRQDPLSPEMAEAWKLHAAVNGHPLSGSVIKEKRQAYGTDAWMDAQMARIQNGDIPIFPRDEISQDKRVPPPDILEEIRAGNNEYYAQPVGNVERRVPPPEMLEEMNAPELAPSARVAKTFKA